MIKCKLCETKDLNQLDKSEFVGYFECVQIPGGGVMLPGGRMLQIFAFYWELDAIATDAVGIIADGGLKLPEAVCVVLCAEAEIIQKRQALAAALAGGIGQPHQQPQPQHAFGNGRAIR